MINDLSHYWGGDLSTSPTGDLAGASGTLRGQQRVLRRLLTNPGDCLAHPDYGAGLPAWVGLPLDVAKVKALIRSQILLEDAVARTPAPEITVRQLSTDLTGLAVRVAYNDAIVNLPVVLSFNVTA